MILHQDFFLTVCFASQQLDTGLVRCLLSRTHKTSIILPRTIITQKQSRIEKWGGQKVSSSFDSKSKNPIFLIVLAPKSHRQIILFKKDWDKPLVHCVVLQRVVVRSGVHCRWHFQFSSHLFSYISL